MFNGEIEFAKPNIACYLFFNMGVVEKEHVKGWSVGEGSTAKANN